MPYNWDWTFFMVSIFRKFEIKNNKKKNPKTDFKIALHSSIDIHFNCIHTKSGRKKIKIVPEILFLANPSFWVYTMVTIATAKKSQRHWFCTHLVRLWFHAKLHIIKTPSFRVRILPSTLPQEPYHPQSYANSMATAWAR